MNSTSLFLYLMQITESSIREALLKFKEYDVIKVMPWEQKGKHWALHINFTGNDSSYKCDELYCPFSWKYITAPSSFDAIKQLRQERET